MRRRSLFYSFEADDIIKDTGDAENPDATIDNPDDAGADGANAPSEGTDTSTDNIDLTSTDETDKDKKVNPGPLNVDLVYNIKRLELNDKTNTEEYRVLKSLQDKRDDPDFDEENNPVALDIKAARYLKDQDEDDGTDLLEDETVSTPNDYDDERYTRMEYTDMSVESFLAMEVHYTNDANEYMLDNMGEVAGRAGHAAANAAAAVGRGVGAVGGAAARKAGAAASIAASVGAKAGGSLIKGGLGAIKGSILALDKFYERHEANFASIEKQLSILHKEVFLLKETNNRKPFTKDKIIRNIVTEDNHDIRELLNNQIKFYSLFSNIVISSLKNESEISKNLLQFATNKELTKLTLKNYTSKRMIESLSKPADDDTIDGPNSHLVSAYESKEILMGNRVLLSVLPSTSIDSIEYYIDAMKLSKVSIYKLNTPTVNELKIPNKKELLSIIDLAIILTRSLRDTKSEFNKIIGIKKNLINTYKYFDIISNTEYYLTVDKKTRKEVSEYLKTSALYMDRIYVDPFINIKNYYYNTLKYLTHYVKDISRL